MNDTFECPFCGYDEGVYFNGICYECVDCGMEWNNSDIEATNLDGVDIYCDS